MKSCLIGLCVFAGLITATIVAVLLVQVRQYWPIFGMVILVSVVSVFILLPLSLVALLVKFLLKHEVHEVGQYGTLLTLFGRVIQLRPMVWESTTIDTTQTALVTPTEQSRPYLAAESAIRALERAGIHLDEPEDEPLAIDEPKLRIVGGVYEGLTDEMSKALACYKDGATGGASLAEAMKISRHKASHLITALKAKGLV